MKYINVDMLNPIDSKAYQQQKPFPYIDVAGTLYDDVYQQLVESAPSDLSLFEKQFGIERSHGQKFHDKYYLLYTDATPVSKPWKEFIKELYSEEYRTFLERMFNMKRNSYRLALSWHYMPRGTEITPHCDTKTKIGSQLFYLNTSNDWKPEWGGQTLALDDEGKMDPFSGPHISDFNGIFRSKGMGNNSFIFTRTEHSWHAVEKINCPDGHMRKMFSVVANRKPSVLKKMKRYVSENFRKAGKGRL